LVRNEINLDDGVERVDTWNFLFGFSITRIHLFIEGKGYEKMIMLITKGQGRMS
jgi:hypothetical protein